MKIKFSTCNNVDGNDFAEAIKIYFEAFPNNERQPIELVKNRILTGKTKLYLGYVNDKVAGIAMLWQVENSDFILLDYLAVKKDKRNYHIGSGIFHFVSNIAKKENKYLLLELEHPLHEVNNPERKRRLNFYIRNGAAILKDVPYYLPSLDNTMPTEMLLLIAPITNNLNFDKSCIITLIKRLYRELYGKEDNDELLNSFIHKMPHRITITNSLNCPQYREDTNYL